MAETAPVQPVKLLVAILYARSPARQQAQQRLAEQWGDIDYTGRDHPFDLTDYYATEMGTGLQRRLISFAALVPPERIRQAKLICNDIEAEFCVTGRRTVNLDIGYLDHNKVVLASVKYAGQKIALGDGIYADLIARYRAGRYQPFEWTFPDFADGRYDEELSEIRSRYLQQLRPPDA